jgi:hypothetical protein
MSEPRKLKAVEQYGERYVQDYLTDAKTRHVAITSDPLEALKFWFGKAFMRGRNDTLSTKFMRLTLEVLQNYQKLEDIDLTNLDDRLAAHGVNNSGDRGMVAGSVRFARNTLQDYDGNIYNWALALIQSGRANEAYWALQGIYEIADKLASFYLRDVTLIEDLDSSIRPEDYQYFQPVDTWVRWVAARLEIIPSADYGNNRFVKGEIISACLDAAVSPLLFNAGAWLVGAHGARLLIERL